MVHDGQRSQWAGWDWPLGRNDRSQRTENNPLSRSHASLNHHLLNTWIAHDFRTTLGTENKSAHQILAHVYVQKWCVTFFLVQNSEMTGSWRFDAAILFKLQIDPLTRCTSTMVDDLQLDVMENNPFCWTKLYWFIDGNFKHDIWIYWEKKRGLLWPAKVFKIALRKQRRNFGT